MSRNLYSVQLFIIDLPNDHVFYARNYGDFEQNLRNILRKLGGNEGDARFLIEVNRGVSCLRECSKSFSHFLIP